MGVFPFPRCTAKPLSVQRGSVGVRGVDLEGMSDGSGGDEQPLQARMWFKQNDGG